MASQEQKTSETELIEVLNEVVPIDISPLLLKGEKERADNADKIFATGGLIRSSLEKYGVVIIRDPRVTYEKNEEFLNMIEDYFNQSTERKKKDVRPELAFQIGATPALQETARNHCQRIANLYDKSNENDGKRAEIHTLDPQHKPWTPCPPEADPKWRYFWRLGSQGVDADTHDEKQKDSKEYVMLNATNVVPQGFKNWSKTCDEWGAGLLNAARTIAEGVAIGYQLKDREYFTKKMEGAPHLLAPTATDLNKYNKYGTIIAGYHYDLNFITVHGKSRYPGLSIFLRDGKKVRVKVPDGCLLAQAAKQLEWMTGGQIYAGFHEVCVNEATVDKIEKVKKSNAENVKSGKRLSPLWRISSTMFSHMRSNVILEPISSNDLSDKTDVVFDTKEALMQYPATKAQKQVVDELKLIGLHVDENVNKKKKMPGKISVNTNEINSDASNASNVSTNTMTALEKIDHLIEYVEALPTK